MESDRPGRDIYTLLRGASQPGEPCDRAGREKGPAATRERPFIGKGRFPAAMASPVDEVLEAGSSLAWAKLGGRALCDACLGRLVGKAGHGLTNTERGGALRERFVVPAGGPCWLCGGLLGEVGKFAD